MAEIVKKATREGYGSGLLKLGEKYDDFIVMDADLAPQPSRAFSKRHSPKDFITAVLPSRI